MANRHLARSVVLQSLFEWDFCRTMLEYKGAPFAPEVKDIVPRIAEEFAAGLSDLSFVSKLTESVLRKQPELDAIIEKAAPEWPIAKISIIDRNVLRVGLYELLFADRGEVPAKVAINEAIELAKTFGGENSGKFVNGVLGAVYKELGEPGKEAPPRTAKQTDPSKLPIDKLVGSVVYARDGADEVHVALVHDVFGHWTLSKGHLKEGEDDAAALKRIIKEEMGLEGRPKEKLGHNEYIASDPEKGRIKKQVVYYLSEADFTPVKLGDKGGLDDARWWKLSDIADLNFYNDIVTVMTHAVTILNKDSSARSAVDAAHSSADATALAMSSEKQKEKQKAEKSKSKKKKSNEQSNETGADTKAA